jgi:hypothetical protein
MTNNDANVNIITPDPYLITVNVNVLDEPGANYNVMINNLIRWSYTPTEPYIAISGGVTAATNNKLDVEFWDGNRAEVMFSLTTNSAGSTRFALFPLKYPYGLPAQIQFSTCNGIGVLATICNLGDVITLTNNSMALTTVVDIPVLTSFSGYVRDVDGNPMKDVLIRMNGKIYLYFDANSTGYFAANDISGGNLTLRVTNSLLYTDGIPIYLPTGLVEFNVTVPKILSIYVYVSDTDGNPITSGLSIWYAGSTARNVVSGIWAEESKNTLTILGDSYSRTNTPGVYLFHFFETETNPIQFTVKDDSLGKFYYSSTFTPDGASLNATVTINVRPKLYPLTGYLTTKNTPGLRPIHIKLPQFCYIDISTPGVGNGHANPNSSGWFNMPLYHGYYHPTNNHAISVNCIGLDGGLAGPAFNWTSDTPLPVVLVLPPIWTVQVFVTDYLGDLITGSVYHQYRYGIYMPCDVTDLPYFSNGECLQSTGGPRNSLTTDESGYLDYSIWQGLDDGEDPYNTVDFICSDIANAARIKTITVPFDGSVTEVTCMLPSRPSPPQSLIAMPAFSYTDGNLTSSDNITLANSSMPLFDPANLTATIQWVPPETNGGSPILQYAVNVTLNATLFNSTFNFSAPSALVGTRWQLLDFVDPYSTVTFMVNPNSTSIMLDSLLSGASYDVSVSALNRFGASNPTIGALVLPAIVLPISSPTAAPSAPPKQTVIVAFNVSQSVSNYSYATDDHKAASEAAFIATVRTVASLTDETSVTIFSVTTSGGAVRLASTPSSSFNYGIQFVVGKGNSYGSGEAGYNAIAALITNSVSSGTFSTTLRTESIARGSTALR